GTVDVDVSELRLDDLRGYVERTFRHIAEAKNVEFLLRTASNLPRSIFTDAKRLQQVIKNLLSNAFKFTQRGEVTLTIAAATDGWSSDNEELNRAATVLAFSVSDTGIGIPPDKQQIIFEAFQQADGSTNRRFGGTGLGLAISRELSRLLGGEIRLTSRPGQGSTFTLYLPQLYTPRAIRKPAAPSDETPSSSVPAASNGSVAESLRDAEQQQWETTETLPRLLLNEVGDDRDRIQPGDRVLLIVENDLAFARLVLERARDKGFKGLVTSRGADALTLTREYTPHVLTLDIFLPDIDGWRVLERLKNDGATRHIPVCVISTDEARERALRSGAMAFLTKPIPDQETLDELLYDFKEFLNRPRRRVLVVEPDAARRERIVQCLAGSDIDVLTAGDGAVALRLIHEQPIDCLIVDAEAPALSPLALVEQLPHRLGVNRLPVLVYSEHNRDDRRDAGATDSWKMFRDVLPVRRVSSPERLLDQAAFFLHQDLSKLPEAQRRMLADLHSADKVLAGKKVLIVDDDIRNIFALSTVLEEHDMAIVSADNGRDAIALLQQQDNIDVVLMDIMMPEMDGLETLRAIRKIPRLKSLPIIAVTAKAMKGDREKCIEAGAWDYLSKPVDTEQMLAVLRAWLGVDCTTDGASGA
ncbi:MAG: response regulator, partial [Gemmataceae bacterium]